MSSHSRTGRPLSGHLWSAALLLAAGAIALAADRLSAVPPALTFRAYALGDIQAFLAPVAGTPTGLRPGARLDRDPLESALEIVQSGVASDSPAPTVNVARPGQQLTAILIADDTPVAVIDGEVVNLGDVLPNGARVAAIRQDRVTLIEKGGRTRVLTLSPERE